MLLDFAKSPKTLTMLRQRPGGKPLSEFSSSVLPILTIKVRGSLKFRPDPGANEIANQHDAKAVLIPVIVVKSLEVVESSF